MFHQSFLISFHFLLVRRSGGLGSWMAAVHCVVVVVSIPATFLLRVIPRLSPPFPLCRRACYYQIKEVMPQNIILRHSEGNRLWWKGLACFSSHTIWHCLDTTYLMLGLEFVFQVPGITHPSRDGKVSLRTENLIEIDPLISYQTRTKHGPHGNTNNIV